MDHIIGMHILNSTDNFFENVCCLILGQSRLRLPFLDGMEQIGALAELHDQMNLGSSVYHLIQAHDVRVF